jgi:hypothetical protein
MSQVLDTRTGEEDDPDTRLGPLRPPGDTTGLFGVFQRRYLLGLLLRKELRVRYQGSLVGLAWSYVKPLIRFFTYLVIVGYVIGLRDTPMYAFHVFSAMVVVTTTPVRSTSSWSSPARSSGGASRSPPSPRLR